MNRPVARVAILCTVLFGLLTPAGNAANSPPAGSPMAQGQHPRVFFTDSDPSAYSDTLITLEVSLTRGAQVVVDTAEVTLVIP